MIASDRKLLEILRAEPGLMVHEIAVRAKRGRTSVARSVSRLLGRGLLERDKRWRNGLGFRMLFYAAPEFASLATLRPGSTAPEVLDGQGSTVEEGAPADPRNEEPQDP